jgi:hypothetical protein
MQDGLRGVAKLPEITATNEGPARIDLGLFRPPRDPSSALQSYATLTLEAQEQARESGLARTREAAEADLLAGADRQRQIFDDRLSGLVGEADFFESDLAGLDLEISRIRPVGDGGRCCHDRHGVLDGADRLEDLLAHLQEREDLCRQPLEDVDGAYELADGEKPVGEARKSDRKHGRPQHCVEDDDSQFRGAIDALFAVLRLQGLLDRAAVICSIEDR